MQAVSALFAIKEKLYKENLTTSANLNCEQSLQSYSAFNS